MSRKSKPVVYGDEKPREYISVAGKYAAVNSSNGRAVVKIISGQEIQGSGSSRCFLVINQVVPVVGRFKTPAAFLCGEVELHDQFWPAFDIYRHGIEIELTHYREIVSGLEADLGRAKEFAKGRNAHSQDSEQPA